MSTAPNSTAEIGLDGQLPPTSETEDWRSSAERLIIFSLAGRCAEARARRPDCNGWRRRMDERERVAWHEAGHIVGAVAVQLFQNGAAIEAVGERCRGIAEYSDVPLENGPDYPTFENFDQLQRDFVKATMCAQLVVGPRGWLTYLRGLWLRTDALLGAHWLCVKMLALELRETGVVRRSRAEEIIGRWYRVSGDSVLEALREIAVPHRIDQEISVAGTDPV